MTEKLSESGMGASTSLKTSAQTKVAISCSHPVRGAKVVYPILKRHMPPPLLTIEHHHHYEIGQVGDSHFIVPSLLKGELRQR